jgi:hypothetical protein
MKNYIRLVQELKGTNAHVGVQTSHVLQEMLDVVTVFIRPWKGQTWEASVGVEDAKKNKNLEVAIELCAKALLHFINPEKYKAVEQKQILIREDEVPPEVWKAINEELPD